MTEDALRADERHRLLWEIGSTLVDSSTDDAEQVVVAALERVARHLSVEAIGRWHADLTADATRLCEFWETDGVALSMSDVPTRVANPDVLDRVLGNDRAAAFPLQVWYDEADLPAAWQDATVMVVLLESDGGQADALVIHRRSGTWADEEVQFCRSFALALRQFLARVEVERRHEERVALTRFVSKMQQLLGDATDATSVAVGDEVVRRVAERFEMRSVACFEIGERLLSVHATGAPVEQAWFDLDPALLPFDMRAKEPEFSIFSIADLARAAFGPVAEEIDFGERQVVIVPIGVADGPPRSFLASREDRGWTDDELEAFVAIGRSFGEMLARTDAERWAGFRLRAQEEFAATLSAFLHGREADVDALVEDALGRVARAIGAPVSAMIDSADAAPGSCGRVVALWEIGDSAFEVGEPVRYPERWVNEAILAGESVVTSLEMPGSPITGAGDTPVVWTLVCAPLVGWFEGPASVGVLLHGDQTHWGPVVTELLDAFGDLLAQLRVRLDLEREADWRERTQAFIQGAASSLNVTDDVGFDEALDAVLMGGASLLGASGIELWSVDVDAGHCALRSAPLRPLDDTTGVLVDAVPARLVEVARRGERSNFNDTVFLPLDVDGFVSVLAAGPFPPDTAGIVVPVLEHLLEVLGRAQRRLAAERQAKTAFEDSPIGVVLCDHELRLLTCNKAFVEFVGHDSVDDLKSTGVDRVLTEHLRQFGAGNHELPFTRANGTEVWGLTHATVIESPVTHQQTWLVHIEDATERRRDEELLRHQASTDDLTGLANRRVLTGAMEEMIATGHAPSVLLLDLDRFKTVNDSLGHDRGDELLVVVADRLRLAVRPGDLVVRLGGDEFAILLESPSDTADAVIVADRLVELLDEPVILAGQSVYPTASIGIAQLDLPTTVSDVLRAADTAMYQAKAAGGSGHATFDRRMRGKVSERLQIEAGLRHAIRNGELSVHYQPEVSLDSGRFLGAEALVRWEHPLRGLIQARRFVPVAEEAGLLASIGAFVLRQACAEAASWDDQDTIVRVNLSTSQLRQVDVLGVVRTALDAAGLPPHRLCIEITEASMTHDADRTEYVLSGLRTLGVGIALDDFGSGFSSLAYLKRFPIDTVKIDRSFVHGLDGPDPDDAFVRSIVSLAEAFDLEVVAEGVESQDQADALIRLGCARAQGFFYARPMPIDELADQFPLLRP